jgi:hypothetical protein
VLSFSPFISPQRYQFGVDGPITRVGDVLWRSDQLDGGKRLLGCEFLAGADQTIAGVAMVRGRRYLLFQDCFASPSAPALAPTASRLLRRTTPGGPTGVGERPPGGGFMVPPPDPGGPGGPTVRVLQGCARIAEPYVDAMGWKWRTPTPAPAVCTLPQTVWAHVQVTWNGIIDDDWYVGDAPFLHTFWEAGAAAITFVNDTFGFSPGFPLSCFATAYDQPRGNLLEYRGASIGLMAGSFTGPFPYPDVPDSCAEARQLSGEGQGPWPGPPGPNCLLGWSNRFHVLTNTLQPFLTLTPWGGDPPCRIFLFLPVGVIQTTEGPFMTHDEYLFFVGGVVNNPGNLPIVLPFANVYAQYLNPTACASGKNPYFFANNEMNVTITLSENP